VRTRRSTKPAGFIWATRGRTWGFRFLRTAGLIDPLKTYEQAFSTIGDATETCRRLDQAIALRFPDPDGRHDAAGRLIPHDFVLFDDWAEDIDSVADGIARIWPAVTDEYRAVWDSVEGPQPRP
jgi:hypothetical protein